ncbi:MAG: hypothetical protein C4520_18325 [Candidatus Abyssobacteria bacterium SURF_5]|uniref:HEAT repeat domain-containing protein n=1 Tax=Abyssobacteria bacterium (strain SURF_5) TaxID=2093360 RepID=A0A3A4NA62_ABYX5|nr:MAG: hypothetical protein C4520_18325 [Candidatus Abyssubacteria bacterium SURF_5]
MDIEELDEIPPWEWPEEADEILLEILRDAHADVSKRVLAADLAGDCAVLNDEIARQLLLIVLSPDEPNDLRAAAVASLGPALEDSDCSDYDDPEEMSISEPMFHEINKSLEELYRGAFVPEEVQRRVLEASAHAPQEWHREAVSAAYSSTDEKWKLSAVFCMRFVGGFDDQIVEALESDNPDILYEAVVAAGRWGTPASWPRITTLLSSKETEKALLLAAIEAAPYVRPEEAVEAVAGFTDSPDDEIAEAASQIVSALEPFPDEFDNTDGLFN